MNGIQILAKLMTTTTKNSFITHTHTRRKRSKSESQFEERKENWTKNITYFFARIEMLQIRFRLFGDFCWIV